MRKRIKLITFNLGNLSNKAIKKIHNSTFVQGDVENPSGAKKIISNS